MLLKTYLVKILSTWLIRRAQKTPYAHIAGSDGKLYMRRWWLIPYNRLGVSARIHEILRSDDDRAYHDHPWWYITIVLRGGYWELKPLYSKSGIYLYEARKWVGAGSILFRRAKSWHRLEIDGAPAWTLFICGRKSQEWGFLVQPAHKAHWRDYLPPREAHTTEEHE